MLDGEYGVTLAYQNLAHDPAASASAAKVAIKTATATPVVLEPAPGQTFRKAFKVTYALPEAALPGSVKLLLIGSHAGTKTFALTNSAGGFHTAEIVPSIPASGTGIASAPLERLPTDSYQLVVSYQDTFANAAATSSSLALNIAYPLCEAGSYSASGEEPCAKAPKGYFVATSGANHASECPIGHFTDAEGLSECLPAPGGSYVPSIGASVYTPCPAGSYAPVSASTSCITTPENTYATGGAAEATPCPAGTQAPAVASSCSAIAKEASAGTVSTTSTSSDSTTNTTPSTAKQPPVLSSPVVNPETVTIATVKHGTSLVRTRLQRYALTCSTAATVQLRGGAVVRAGAKHLALTAPILTLKCKAGKATGAAAGFKLTSAAKALLHKHGAAVKVTVRVYATGAAAGTQLASATVRGKP